MSYESTFIHKSAILQGVEFIVRKPSHGRRIALNERTASINAELREANSNLSIVTARVEDATDRNMLLPCTCPTVIGGGDTDHEHDEYGECKMCDCRKIPAEMQTDITETYRIRIEVIWNGIITTKLYPTLMRWAIQSISGKMDGVDDPTVDQFLELAPDEAVVEIGRIIDSLTRMNMKEVEAFASPGTSSTPVTGPQIVMSA